MKEPLLRCWKFNRDLNIDLLGFGVKEWKIFEWFLASLEWPKVALRGLLDFFFCHSFVFDRLSLFIYPMKFTFIPILFWRLAHDMPKFDMGVWVYGFSFFKFSEVHTSSLVKFIQIGIWFCHISSCIVWNLGLMSCVLVKTFM